MCVCLAVCYNLLANISKWNPSAQFYFSEDSFLSQNDINYVRALGTVNVYLATSYLLIFTFMLPPPPPSSTVVFSESMPGSATRIFYFIFSKSVKEGTEGSGRRSQVRRHVICSSRVSDGNRSSWSVCSSRLPRDDCVHEFSAQVHSVRRKINGKSLKVLEDDILYKTLVRVWDRARPEEHVSTIFFLPLRLVSKTVFILICLLFSSYLFFPSFLICFFFCSFS